ncbi:MAG: 50S ribosomal protein L20 [Bryobacterales bacterium]|nr:50S ribosomal protein L20 [Bryobacterales bacterium]
MSIAKGLPHEQAVPRGAGSCRKGPRVRLRGRKQKKRNFRSLWIVRIGAALATNGISYSSSCTG